MAYTYIVPGTDGVLPPLPRLLHANVHSESAGDDRNIQVPASQMGVLDGILSSWR